MYPYADTGIEDRTNFGARKKMHEFPPPPPPLRADTGMDSAILPEMCAPPPAQTEQVPYAYAYMYHLVGGGGGRRNFSRLD